MFEQKTFRTDGLPTFLDRQVPRNKARKSPHFFGEIEAVIAQMFMPTFGIEVTGLNSEVSLNL